MPEPRPPAPGISLRRHLVALPDAARLALSGAAQLGGAFYREVPPGIYHVEVESYGKDFDQSTNVALVPGQDAYVKIESLGSWSTFVGAGYVAARDTSYARLMLPQIARSEIVQSFFDGGS